MKLNNKHFLVFASFLGLTAVAIGAFGAHAWKDLLLKNGKYDAFKTASFYHFIHALLLFGISHIKALNKSLVLAKYFIGVGVLLFSGSLYLIALTTWPSIAFVTPIGGIILMMAWCALIFYSIQNSK